MRIVVFPEEFVRKAPRFDGGAGWLSERQIPFENPFPGDQIPFENAFLGDQIPFENPFPGGPNSF